MVWKALGHAAIAASLLAAASVALADEVVYFTNGAEMPVRSHTIDKDMVKLDLGGSSSISFPVTMVAKIADAGRDVFVNPTYKPVNQAVAGIPGSSQPVQVQYPISNGGVANVGFRQRPGHDAGNGTMLGEPAIGESDPASRLSKINGTTVVRDPRHPFLSSVTIPAINAANPIPLTGTATIQPPNQAGPPRTYQTILPRSPASLAPPLDPSASPAPTDAPPPADPNPPAPSDPGSQSPSPSN